MYKMVIITIVALCASGCDASKIGWSGIEFKGQRGKLKIGSIYVDLRMNEIYNNMPYEKQKFHQHILDEDRTYGMFIERNF